MAEILIILHTAISSVERFAPFQSQRFSPTYFCSSVLKSWVFLIHSSHPFTLIGVSVFDHPHWCQCLWPPSLVSVSLTTLIVQHPQSVAEYPHSVADHHNAVLLTALSVADCPQCLGCSNTDITLWGWSRMHTPEGRGGKKIRGDL